MSHRSVSRSSKKEQNKCVTTNIEDDVFWRFALNLEHWMRRQVQLVSVTNRIMCQCAILFENAQFIRGGTELTRTKKKQHRKIEATMAGPAT